MEVRNPLYSSQIYPYLHQFILGWMSSTSVEVSSQVLLSEVFCLCCRAAIDPLPGEKVYARYVMELKSRYGSDRLAEMILCLSWVVLMVQEKPSYALNAFAQQLHSLIRHASIYVSARQLAVNIRQHERHIHTDFELSPGYCYEDLNPVCNIDAQSNSISRKKTMNIADKEVIREEVLTWVSRVRPLLIDSWKTDFLKYWEDILNMPEVKERIFNPGKQKHTNFNQYLVGNILYYMFDECGAWSEDDDYNASAVCMKLIGTTEHQLRKELAKNPPEDISKRLYSYFTKK